MFLDEQGLRLTLFNLKKQAGWLEDSAVYNGNYSDSLGLKVRERATQQNKFPLIFIGITMRTNTRKIDSGKSFATQYCENDQMFSLSKGISEREDAPEIL